MTNSLEQPVAASGKPVEEAEKAGELENSAGGENQPENQNESANETGEASGAEKPEESSETVAEVIDDWRQLETPEDEKTVIDPDRDIANLDAALADTEQEVGRLKELAEKENGSMDQVRQDLGLESKEPAFSEQERLAALEAKMARLEDQKEEAERVKDLESVLVELGQLPPAELKIVIETGKGSNGQELETKHGKVSPDVAKSLAKAAESGATKITKAILKTVLGIVKGVLIAIFEVVTGKE